VDPEPAVYRILDANANRAREAIRVMEEHARFALNDRALAEAAKSLRHELADTLRPVTAAGASVMRDTPRDVGTQLTADGEYARTGLADVVRTSGKRLTEALRVLEEYGKLIDAALAARLEQLRYRAYAFEQAIVHVSAARDRLGEVGLYVLITERLCRGSWQGALRGAAAGGARAFQLREKDLDDRALFARAVEFRELCRATDTLCIINDRADIAVAVDADGVHVGQDDLSITAARQVVGPRRIVGISTHDVPQAESAAAQRPDYVAVGPMFATALKPDTQVAGPETLRAVRAGCALPLAAIGGIAAENAAALRQSGANMIAACSAVISQENPQQAAECILHAFNT
jgi:thiamine-phosphate pyrophosphorylase